MTKIEMCNLGKGKDLYDNVKKNDKVFILILSLSTIANFIR